MTRKTEKEFLIVPNLDVTVGNVRLRVRRNRRRRDMLTIKAPPGVQIKQRTKKRS